MVISGCSVIGYITTGSKLGRYEIGPFEKLLVLNFDPV